MSHSQYFKKSNFILKSIEKSSLSQINKFKESLQRLNNRELAFFRERYEPHDGERTTLQTINEKRKKDIMTDYDKKFASKFVPGIHK